MGKLFKLTGNFTQFDGWTEPDPAFEGEFYVDGEDVLLGYSEELYMGTQYYPKAKTRYLIGEFALDEQTGKTGLYFIKLTNNIFLAPILYKIPDIENPDCGEWAAPENDQELFTVQGKARIKLEEFDVSEEAIVRIDDRFDELDRRAGLNADLMRYFEDNTVYSLVNAKPFE